ncbi:MAG TPA: GNAT family N-acetyltransferase [Alphaproteobacteria bacterium]|nr:GNAT family N-acetyltransferase [Alphaproteobacteria bacterium]
MIRRLGAADLRQIERHYLGLSVEDRRYRFNTPLSDSAIRARIASFDWRATTLIGYFNGKTLRGVAELATLKGDMTDAGEVALSVDGAHRRRGIARRLVTEAAAQARALGCRRLVFWWHPENVGFARFLTACGGRIFAHPPAGWLEIPAAGARLLPFASVAGASARHIQGPTVRNGHAA